MNLWLSREIFDWTRVLLNPRTSQDWEFLKPYRLLQHAKKRLDEVDDKESPDQENLALGDSVSHLKGAIEHREKQLKDKFNLAGLSIWGTPKGKTIRVYEKLYRLGITQPILHKKLIDLRNLVVHEQKFPSSKNKSEISELYEFTWYFIRSTDSFLARDISGMILYPPNFSAWHEEDNYDGCFQVRFHLEPNWQVDIRGIKVPINFFSRDEKRDWLELAINDFNDDDIYEELGVVRIDWSVREHKSDRITDRVKVEARKKRVDKYFMSGENVKYVDGTLIGPPESVNTIITEYFELYMFY